MLQLKAVNRKIQSKLNLKTTEFKVKKINSKKKEKEKTSRKQVKLAKYVCQFLFEHKDKNAKTSVLIAQKEKMLKSVWNFSYL